MGGAERHTLDLRARLMERGYPTSVVVFGRGRSPQTLALPGAQGARMLGCRGLADFGSWLRIGKALRQENADVLFVVNQAPTIVTLPFRWSLRGKVVGIFHTTVPRPGEGPRTALFRIAARFLDRLVYVSVNQRAYWRARGLTGTRDEAIVNGIDLDHFAPRPGDREATRAAWGVQPDDFVMGLVATMRPEKNHAQLVDALVALRQRGIPAKIVFVGNGPDRERLTQVVETAGMTPHVVFTGEQGDVRPSIAGFDVGVLCSTSIETLSLSALEILAGGVPLVISEIGGASEIVQDGVNGYLFEVGRTDQLIDRLARVAQPEQRARLAGATLRTAAAFSVDRMLASYIALVDDLVAPGR
jgi:glycosyltransferase involved in cell wall biosynthesis